MWCLQREAEVNVSHFSSQTSFECMHRDFQKDFNIKMIICPQKVIPDVLHF